jgi:hypothetical protein
VSTPIKNTKILKLHEMQFLRSAFHFQKAVAKAFPWLFALSHPTCHPSLFLTSVALWRIQSDLLQGLEAFKFMGPVGITQMHQNSTIKNHLMLFFNEYFCRDTIKM